MDSMTAISGQQVLKRRRIGEVKGEKLSELACILLTFLVNCVTFTLELSKL